MENMLHLLAGTFVSGNESGIYIFRFDQESGKSAAAGKIETNSPSYFVASKKGECLYALSGSEDTHSHVNAFSYGNGLKNPQQTDSILNGDDGPCYITIDKNNRHVITANYGGGSISVFDTDMKGGFYKMSQLIAFSGQSIHPERQTKPHIHCVEFTPDGKFLLAADLGTDNIYQMEIDYNCDECTKEFVVNSMIRNIKVTEGSGPRHITFHPDGKYFYVTNELSDTIITFSYNGGEITQLQEIPIVTNNAGGSADVVITPDGKYLYASVRLKNDGVTIFRVQTDGLLERIDYQPTGIHPRNLRITPNGKYLLVSCRDDSRIEVYKIDEKTGLLKNIKKDIHITEPACLKFI